MKIQTRKELLKRFREKFPSFGNHRTFSEKRPTYQRVKMWACFNKQTNHPVSNFDKEIAWLRKCGVGTKVITFPWNGSSLELQIPYDKYTN
jgi:hypothetical protein